jgi:hypothetical protein
MNKLMKLKISLGFWLSLSYFVGGVVTIASAQDKALIIKAPAQTKAQQETTKQNKPKTIVKKKIAPVVIPPEKKIEPIVEKTVDKPIEKSEPVAESIEVWQPSSARGLKKKLLISAFSIAKINQVSDLDNPAQGFPLEIQKRLQQNHLVLGRYTPESLLSDAQQIEPSRGMILQVAGQYDSQFVITGHIQHAEEKVDEKLFGLWNKHKRTLEVEVVIHEGQSGLALKRKKFTAWAADDKQIGRDKTFAGASFAETSFGKVIVHVIAQASEWIAAELENLPMMTRVVKVEGGQIFLDAGSSSFISAGDVGTLVAESESLPLIGMRAVQPTLTIIGKPSQDLGLIKIQATQTNFSEAKLAKDIKPDSVKVGQWVRFEK